MKVIKIESSDDSSLKCHSRGMVIIPIYDKYFSLYNNKAINFNYQMLIEILQNLKSLEFLLLNIDKEVEI